ncbi:hypothetical protein CTER_1270 [Ruminiclostridium cellobioparum subsp. termitidis CT1112]|uniref:Uncharacterized protein n=1 Tax=Ruminiclostridium cellobioparum subsp. termitidis CT1112 TaxID=1195236 RepID=S0FQJ1_RUMCE|nr:hypothetical protein CTER_1270 [Ruminiclostridium cellobioparum subsp. termitidis CT1112]
MDKSFGGYMFDSGNGTRAEKRILYELCKILWKGKEVFL